MDRYIEPPGPFTVEFIGPCYSQCGLGTSNIEVTWEHVNSVESQVPSCSTGSETTHYVLTNAVLGIFYKQIHPKERTEVCTDCFPNSGHPLALFLWVGFDEPDRFNWGKLKSV